jgi:hypothetical protein
VDAHQLRRAQWRTSTYSGQNGSCVQVAANPLGIVGIRDSKKPDGPKLVFASAGWMTFICRIKDQTLGFH